VAQPPQFLTLVNHRDRVERVEPVARWLLFGLLTLLFALALANVFGQHPHASVVSGEGARLEVSAPTSVRGGLFFQGRFTIAAEREIDNATLVLDQGWLESMHINTIEPAPVGEATRDGRLALDFGHVAAGERIVAYLQFQVNPTNLGRRSQTVELYDDETLLASAERTVTIFP
jgi:hypothetical protein